MPRQAREPWKLDWTSGYSHVPLHAKMRGSMVVFWDGHLWAMTSLPFGLGSAVEAFQCLTNVPARILQKDTLALEYIDDTCGVQPQSGQFPNVEAVLAQAGIMLGGVHPACAPPSPTLLVG